MTGIRIARLEPLVFRAPIPVPVRTSFGVMHARPALLVRAEDGEGAVGWGEIWCNFPACGAEHRARLVTTVLADWVKEAPFADPAAVWRRLSARARILAIQAGEPGPLAHAIAGIDIALWDLAARRAGQKLWRHLGGAGSGVVKVYASGINPDGAMDTALGHRAAGHRAFKLKVGFGRERDLANMAALRQALGADTPVMIDANQAWDVATALDMARALAPFGPAWLEEPIPADSTDADWGRLAAEQPLPLAAGENMRGEREFEWAIGSGHFAVVQPDLAKWGGFSGCLPVARAALAAGRRFCPHYLGGGIGLVASAHLLAAAGNDDLLELDGNDNPLRAVLAQPYPAVTDGRMALPDGPGLGVAPDLEAAREFLVAD